MNSPKIHAFEFGESIEEAKFFLKDEEIPHYEHIIDDADNGQYRYPGSNNPFWCLLKENTASF